MHEFRWLLSQSDLVGTQNTYHYKLHLIKQLNEGVKSLVACIGHTFCHAQHVCLHGGVSMTGGGSKMKFKLQKHVYEFFFFLKFSVKIQRNATNCFQIVTPYCK